MIKNDVTFIEIKNCPVCGSSKNDFIAERIDGIKLVECIDCTLIYARHLPEDLSYFYPANYLDNSKDALSGYKDYFNQITSFWFYWTYNLINAISASSTKENRKKSLLDIGCASGSLMELFRDNGYETFGIDIIEKAIKIAKKKGLTCDLGNIQNYDFNKKTFQIITALEVFEHLIDLKAFLKKIYDLLNDDGIFFFFVPGGDKNLFNKYGKDYHWLNNSIAHTVYFTEKSLQVLLNEFFPDNYYIFQYPVKFNGQEFLDIFGYIRKKSTNIKNDRILHNILSSERLEKIDTNLPVEFYTTKALIDAKFYRHQEAVELMEKIKKNYSDKSLNFDITYLIIFLHKGAYLQAYDMLKQICSEYFQDTSYCELPSYFRNIFIKLISSNIGKEFNNDVNSITDVFEYLKDQINRKNSDLMNDYRELKIDYNKLIDDYSLLQANYYSLDYDYYLLRKTFLVRLQIFLLKIGPGKILLNSLNKLLALGIKFYKVTKKLKSFIISDKRSWSNDKNPRPLISVVIPCFNYGDFIEQAIDSVLSQTFQDFEIIVVNDGSTDQKTIDVLKTLSKPKTTIIHQKNMGVISARNNGVAKTRGKYICCLDADDMIEPTYLEKCLTIMESRPHISIAYSSVKTYGDKDSVWETHDLDFEKILDYNHLIVSSVYRKVAWKEVGGYHQYMIGGYEDWDFWSSLAEKGYKGKQIKEYLFYYNVKAGSRHTRSRTRHSTQQGIINSHHKKLKDKTYRDKISKRFPVSKSVEPFINMNNPNSYLQKTGKKNILILLPWLVIGGAETLLYNLLTGIKDDYTIFIVSAEKFLDGQVDNREIFIKLTPYIYNTSLYIEDEDFRDYIINFIRIHKIDLLFIANGSHFFYDNLEYIKKQYSELPVINLLHNDDSKDGWFLYCANFKKYIDHWIVITNKIRNSVEENYRSVLSRLSVIYNGIDVMDKYNPSLYDKERIKEKLEISGYKYIISHIGRIAYGKRSKDFIEIVNLLKNYEDVHFLIAGNGPEMWEIYQMISNYNLADKVKILGFYQPITEILAVSDLMVLCSEVEGYPISVMEAMSMEVPVISTDVGEISSMITHETNGFLYEVSDINNAVNNIRQLIDNTEMLVQFKKRARETALEKFNSKIMSEQYKIIFDKYLNQSKSLRKIELL